MQDSLQELVKAPMRGTQTWREAGEARRRGRWGRAPAGLLKHIWGNYANDRWEKQRAGTKPKRGEGGGDASEEHAPLMD